MRTPHLSLLPLALTLVLAGCGGGGDGSAAGPTTPSTPSAPSTPSGPSASATISMRTDSDGYGGSTSAFVPAQVTVTRGGTVRFSNGTGIPHNVTFAAVAGAPADVANHASGDETRTFATSGTFPFQCTNHAGMSGSVVVVP